MAVAAARASVVLSNLLKALSLTILLALSREENSLERSCISQGGPARCHIGILQPFPNLISKKSRRKTLRNKVQEEKASSSPGRTGAEPATASARQGATPGPKDT